MSDDPKKLTTGDIGHDRITDAEAVSMARFLVQRDGLFLGSSSAVNLVACVKLARKMGWSNGEKVVTVLYVFPSYCTIQPCIHLSLTTSPAQPAQFHLIGVIQAPDTTPRFVLLPF